MLRDTRRRRGQFWSGLHFECVLLAPRDFIFIHPAIGGRSVTPQHVSDQKLAQLLPHRADERFVPAASTTFSNDLFRAGLAILLELRKHPRAITRIAQQLSEIQRIFQSKRCALSRVRAHSMLGISDQNDALAMPGRKRFDVVDVHAQKRDGSLEQRSHRANAGYIDNEVPAQGAVDYSAALELPDGLLVTPVSLTSSSNWADMRRFADQDITFLASLSFGAPIPWALHDRSWGKLFTQEVRLQSLGESPAQWLIGGFYLNQDADLSQFVPDYSCPACLPTLLAGQDFALDYPRSRFSEQEQRAVIGDISYVFASRWTVGAGARYLEEDLTALDGAVDGILTTPTTQTTQNKGSVYELNPSAYVGTYRTLRRSDTAWEKAFDIVGDEKVTAMPDGTLLHSALGEPARWIEVGEGVFRAANDDLFFSFKNDRSGSPAYIVGYFPPISGQRVEELIFKIPTMLYIALALPLLALVPAMAALYFVVVVWKSAACRMRTRIYYSVTTLTTILFLWILSYWNLLGYHFG